MKRTELEHIIRAAGAVSGEDDIVIIGSQAVLGYVPEAPEELLVSRKADVFPLHAPEKADLIDGAIGGGSPFEEEFGYYAHGVGPETAVLPEGWKERLKPIRNEMTRGVTGWCLHPVDLAVSKLVAGRRKDILFIEGLLRHGIVEAEAVRSGILALPEEKREPALLRLERIGSGAG